MKLLDSITNAPNQTFKIALDSREKVTFSLTYKEIQVGWFYSLTVGSFSIKNRRIVNSPNMLRAFREILDFGLACIVSGAQEPIYMDDFSSGRAKIYVLNSSDVSLVETDVI